MQCGGGLRWRQAPLDGLYRSADLAHWLALDIATQALADAGFEENQALAAALHVVAAAVFNFGNGECRLHWRSP